MPITFGNIKKYCPEVQIMTPVETSKIQTTKFYSKKYVPRVFSNMMAQQQSSQELTAEFAGEDVMATNNETNCKIRSTNTRKTLPIGAKTRSSIHPDSELSRKRSSSENANQISHHAPCKKSKLDENANESKNGTNIDKILTETAIKQKQCAKSKDIIDLCNDMAVDKGQQGKHTSNETKTRTRRQQKLIEMLTKSRQLLKNSEGDQETFRILEESSQSTSSHTPSPLVGCLDSTSSGFGSSSSTASSPSPDTQSSITKYLLSTKADCSPASEPSPCLNQRIKSALRYGKETTPSPPILNKKAQLYLDLGQKDFGHVTCPTCNMVYTRAQPEDEADHMKFHQKLVNSLRFKGWKTERELEHFDDGRIIVVLPKDHVTHLKKVLDVRSVVDDELGFSSETTLRMQDAQTYMFITNNKVVGCVVAVEIEQAYPMLATKDNKKRAEEQGAWCCSSTPARAQCGISRVWVLRQYRRQGIASRLLDCVRNHFLYGCVVEKNAVAFSDPTPMGKLLAESYIGSKTFLVFR